MIKEKYLSYVQNHRWAILLKQQSSITVFRLLTKENKLLFFVCSKQMEVCRFRFPFPTNKQKLPFSISSVFRLQNSGNMETWTWRHRDGDTETWRHRHGDMEHGEMETWRHGDVETWRHGDMEPWIWIYLHGDKETLNGECKMESQAIFLTHVLTVQTEVCRLSLCWRRNKQKLSICKWTKRTLSSMYTTHINTLLLTYLSTYKALMYNHTYCAYMCT